MILIQVLISFAILGSLVAIIRPFGPIKSRGQAILAFIGLCILNAVVAIARPESKSSDPQTKATDIAPAKPAVPTEEQAPKENWSYSYSTDEMSGAVRRTACTKSSNELSFSFPYSGGSTGELCFRKKAGQLDSWVTISSGQFLCGVEDCQMRLKFDDGPIQSFGVVESTTHESNFLFIESSSRLLASTKKSKKLKLQADYFQEGSKVLQFDLEGLDTSKLDK